MSLLVVVQPQSLGLAGGRILESPVGPSRRSARPPRRRAPGRPPGPLRPHPTCTASSFLRSGRDGLYSRRGRAKHRCEPSRRLSRWPSVQVPRRRLNLRVSHCALDGHDVNATRDEQGPERVPEVVPAERTQPCRRARTLEPAAQGRAVDAPADLIAEHKVTVRCEVLPLREPVERSRCLIGKWHAANVALLGWSLDARAHGTADRQCRAGPVDVVPP